MKHFYFFILFFFSSIIATAQWRQVTDIPKRDVVALTVNDNTIYAASSKNKIYKSSNAGDNWNEVTVSNNLIDITALKFYNDILFVGTAHFGVFFSRDKGDTWQNNGTGPGEVSEFAISNNILYASTLGNGVSVLNAANNTWSSFNNALPSYSVNVNSITGAGNFLLTAAGANGTFYRYNFTNNSWHEEYYDGILHPGVLVNKIIHSADTIFATNFNRIIRSNNAGVTWANDQQGTHVGFYRAMHEGTEKYYTITDMVPTGTWIQERNKHAVIGTSWTPNEEFLPDGFAYDILEHNKRLFLAKGDGLYIKDIVTGPVPVQFTSFNAACNNNKVVLSWKTAQEFNNDHFEIQRSTGGNVWTNIGRIESAGNSSSERTYTFTNNTIAPANNFYRIAQFDRDEQVRYSNTVALSCNKTGTFAIWPNPVQNNAFVNIFSSNATKVEMKVFDSKGALIQEQSTNINAGNNQVKIDMRPVANGVYILRFNWNDGKNRRSVRLIKQ